MPTIKEKKLAKALVENMSAEKPMHLQDILVSVGYAYSTADKNSSQIIDQVGTIKALAELGFTKENAQGVVAEILLDKRKNAGDRLRAAEQVFKVTGSYAPEKTLHVTATLPELEKFKKITEEYEEKLLEEIKNNA